MGWAYVALMQRGHGQPFTNMFYLSAALQFGGPVYTGSARVPPKHAGSQSAWPTATEHLQCDCTHVAGAAWRARRGRELAVQDEQHDEQWRN